MEIDDKILGFKCEKKLAQKIKIQQKEWEGREGYVNKSAAIRRLLWLGLAAEEATRKRRVS